MSIRYVDPHTVLFREEPDRHAVKLTKRVLAAQGMIEPIEVDSDMYVKSCYPYAEAMIQAAREEGWETVIVCDYDPTCH